MMPSSRAQPMKGHLSQNCRRRSSGPSHHDVLIDGGTKVSKQSNCHETCQSKHLLRCDILSGSSLLQP